MCISYLVYYLFNRRNKLIFLRMEFKLVTFVVITFLMQSFGIPSGIQKKVDKEIKDSFNI